MKLFKNFIYNSAYQVLILFLPFITMPYVSRILGPEGIGINSYTYSTVMFFTLFGSLGLSMYGTREIATVQDDIVKRSNIFWNIFIFRFCTVLIAWVIFLFVILSKNEYYIFYLAQSILFLSTMCDISWYFVGMEQFKTIVARNTVLKVITVILIIIYIKHSDDLLIYIIFVNLGTLVANISMMASLRNNIKKPVWGKIFTTRFFIPFLPAIALFLPNIAANIYLLLNKVMIGKLDSVVAAGFYQQADSIVKIIVAVVTSLGTVLMPRVSNLFATNQMTKIKQYVHKSMDFSLFLSLPVMAGLSSISAYFVPWFFGSGYNKVIVLIDIESITLILIAISNVLGMQFLVPTRRTREFTLSISIGAIINIALNPLAIVYWGAVGAMFVTVIAELVVVLVQVFVLRHEISFISLFKQSWKYCVCTIIMTLVIVTLNYYMNSSYSNWLIIAVDVILGSLIYIIGNSLLRTNMFLECLRFIKKG